MRRTKIIATIGPASSSPEVLRQLMVAGVDVFRLNFSHGNHESHSETYHAIRAAAATSRRQIAIMQDLSGPKIRTGPLHGGTPLVLVAGETLRIAAGDEPGGPGRIYTPYEPLIDSARPGDCLLLDDGRIELRVVHRAAHEIVTTVVNGGSLGQKKGINAPGVHLPPSAITAKDAGDLRFGLELGVDLVAFSFVQTADDMRHGRTLMADAGRVVPAIAKVERPAAVENLDAILEVADGVMVARGDLGLEMPLEQVPRIQKQIIFRSRSAGLPVILATQVLESMRVQPRPTRAEVSDAANAVEEGADAIMLAGETAAGAFPVRAAETLDAVIRDAELVPSTQRVIPVSNGNRHGRALCEAAITLASTARADAIVAVTRQGKTARLLASLRPPSPVFAATARRETAAAASLLWGITPVLTPASAMADLEQLLVSEGLVRKGSIVVFVNVSAELKRTDANFINVQRLE